MPASRPASRSSLAPIGPTGGGPSHSRGGPSSIGDLRPTWAFVSIAWRIPPPCRVQGFVPVAGEGVPLGCKSAAVAARPSPRTQIRGGAQDGVRRHGTFTLRPAGRLGLISRAARSEGAAGGRRCLSLRVRRPATPERRATCSRMSLRHPAGRPVNSNHGTSRHAPRRREEFAECMRRRYNY